jgi:hypothetical protein
MEAALTLNDAGSIHEADTRLRMQQRRRQAAARHRFDGLEGRSPAMLRAAASPDAAGAAAAAAGCRPVDALPHRLPV